MTNINKLDELVDKLCSTALSLREERDRLRQEVEELRGKFAEKDLEMIRAGKESRRAVEVLEREKMALRKEKEQMEGQLKAIHERISVVMPDLVDGVRGTGGERSAGR